MPRTPHSPAPPTNGRQPDIEVVVRGESAEKLAYFAEMLGVTPDRVVDAWLDTWAPVPDQARS